MTTRAQPSIARSRYAEIDGIERAGTGEVVVFMHGIGGRGQSFSRLMEAWPSPHRLWAWDMPGYGASRAVSSPAPMARDYADQAIRAFDAMQVERVHIVAQSLGALIGASAARHHARRVKSLTLIAPAQGLNAPRGHDLPARAQERSEALKTEGSVAYARKRAPRVVFHPHHIPDVEREMATLNVEGHTQACHVLAYGHLPDDLQQCTAPLAVIAGAEDLITPLDGIAAMVDALPLRSVHFTTLRQCGHAAYFDQPNAVQAAIHANMERAP